MLMEELESKKMAAVVDSTVASHVAASSTTGAAQVTNAITTSRQQRKALERENENWPVRGREIARDQWPDDGHQHRVRVIRSRDYLIQVYVEAGDVTRLSVNRTKMLTTGRWDDGLSWDELQDVKCIAGFANRWAVEVYPAESEVVNVANMRHLWILPEPPAFAWRKLP